MFNDEEEDENAISVVRYPCMPSLVSLQQMRNRLHLAYLGRKLMKWSALATGRELRRLGSEINAAYKSFAEDLRNAFMLLARGRYFYPNLNKMVLENVPNTPSVLVASSVKTISGVKVIQYDLVESGIEPYEHLGIEKGGQKIHEAKVAWLELLKRMIMMLELRTSFALVETAHKNATKKENVLAKIIVPRLMVTVQYILGELEEREREEIFRLKRVKQHKSNLAGEESRIDEEDETEKPGAAQKIEEPVILVPKDIQTPNLGVTELKTESEMLVEENVSTFETIIEEPDPLLFFEKEADVFSDIIQGNDNSIPTEDFIAIDLDKNDEVLIKEVDIPQLEPDIIKTPAPKTEKEIDELQSDKNTEIEDSGQALTELKSDMRYPEIKNLENKSDLQTNSEIGDRSKQNNELEFETQSSETSMSDENKKVTEYSVSKQRQDHIQQKTLNENERAKSENDLNTLISKNGETEKQTIKTEKELNNQGEELNISKELPNQEKESENFDAKTISSEEILDFTETQEKQSSKASDITQQEPIKSYEVDTAINKHDTVEEQSGTVKENKKMLKADSDKSSELTEVESDKMIKNLNENIKEKQPDTMKTERTIETLETENSMTTDASTKEKTPKFIEQPSTSKPLKDDLNATENLETSEKESAKLEKDPSSSKKPGSSENIPDQSNDKDKEDKKNNDPDEGNPGGGGGNNMVVLQVEGLVRISEAILPFAMLSLETMNEFDDLFDGEWDYLDNLPEIKMPKMDLNTTLALSSLAKVVGEKDDNGKLKKLLTTKSKIKSNLNVSKNDSNKVIVIDKNQTIIETPSMVLTSAERTLQEIKELIIKMKTEKDNKNDEGKEIGSSKATCSTSKIQHDSDYYNMRDELKEKEMRVFSLSHFDQAKISTQSLTINRNNHSPIECKSRNVENKIDKKNKRSNCKNIMQKAHSDNNNYCNSFKSCCSLLKIKSMPGVDKNNEKVEDTALKEKKIVTFRNDFKNDKDVIRSIQNDKAKAKLSINRNKQQKQTEKREVVKVMKNKILQTQQLESRSVTSNTEERLSQNSMTFQISKFQDKSNFDIQSILNNGNIAQISDTSFNYNDFNNYYVVKQRYVEDLTFVDLDTENARIEKNESSNHLISLVNTKHCSNSSDVFLEKNLSSKEYFQKDLVTKSANDKLEIKDTDSDKISKEHYDLRPLVLKPKCTINNSKELYPHNSSETKPTTFGTKYIFSSDSNDIGNDFPEDLTFKSDDDSMTSAELDLNIDQEESTSHRSRLRKRRSNT